MPRVSFILPAYKRRFLREAIASILNQTYNDFELVVVDDCSPENLNEIVASFHDERLTYHRNGHNLGGKSLVAAWNHAMEYARGEYSVLASDDDVYLSEYLSNMLRLSEKYPGTSLFHCRFSFIDGKGGITGISEPRSEYESPIELFYNRSIRRMEQRAPDFMFRMSRFRQIGGFIDFPRAWYSDDATWLAFARCGGCVCSHEMLFKWRVSSENISSLSTDADEKIDAACKFLEWAVAYLEDLTPGNASEEYMLSQCRKLIGDVVERGMRFDVNGTGPSVWMKVIMNKELKLKLRLKFLKDRIKKWAPIWLNR